MDVAGREQIADALRFALEAHGDQTRKGTRIPYVSHLLRTAGLVLGFGGDAAQTAAALLHDTLEDCPGVTEAGLRARFGDDVAGIVRALTDVLEGDTPEKKSPWLERKTRYLAHLASVPPRTQLVAACDKLDNLRSLVDDLAEEGPATLERFSGTPPQLRWYYEEVTRLLAGRVPERLTGELERLLSELARFVPEARREGRAC
jgi:(p)ppGpp synthase/HD superfamily hydrolase